ncbi:hypothetical protein EV368DRAFT_65249 [Lentinula lateritia]|uniref:Uncharacterized protein n=1 Tax=Lentinula aff. lateritia TaxID=2804960 RepID=A0ACC1UBK5_9AGAR|nr:hypothetical protein F5876DRAFT_62608 [Lentinula aff. lateritia]KAJ3852046.1 hypothetical protein EV368DRAFT_65249 [Lentinula lateritia]
MHFNLAFFIIGLVSLVSGLPIAHPVSSTTVQVHSPRMNKPVPPPLTLESVTIKYNSALPQEWITDALKSDIGSTTPTFTPDAKQKGAEAEMKMEDPNGGKHTKNVKLQLKVTAMDYASI